MSDIPAMSDVQRRTAVPEDKLKAVLAVFDQILFTEGDEASRILAQMRGRRGRRQVLTFGELLSLADGEQINAAARAIGIDDLGAGPPVVLARVLPQLAHPSVDICEVCHRYPVSEEGGVTTLLREGRCPHCNKGLISVVEQEKPYLRWTDLVETAPGVTHDREIMPHLPLPTHNDAILEGKDWFRVAPMVLEACKAEGLMHGEVANVAHLCAFFYHGPLKSRFDGAEKVLVALQTPSNIGVYDLTSMRAIVRQAMQWSVPSAAPGKGAPVPVPPPPAVATIELPGWGGKRAYIAKLLATIFNTRELRRFLTDVYGEDGSLSEGGGMAGLSNDAVDWLTRRGFVQDGPNLMRFFDVLRQMVPDQAANIDKVAEACGCAPPKPLSPQLRARICSDIMSGFQDFGVRSTLAYALGDNGGGQLPSNGMPFSKVVSELVELCEGAGKLKELFDYMCYSEYPGRRMHGRHAEFIETARLVIPGYAPTNPWR